VARDGAAARGPVAGLEAHDDTYVTREQIQRHVNVIVSGTGPIYRSRERQRESSAPQTTSRFSTLPEFGAGEGDVHWLAPRRPSAP